ncbi:MAG: hypothetical protein ABIF71_08905 [Planctomycetota bacterium]
MNKRLVHLPTLGIIRSFFGRLNAACAHGAVLADFDRSGKRQEFPVDDLFECHQKLMGGTWWFVHPRAEGADGIVPPGRKRMIPIYPAMLDQFHGSLGAHYRWYICPWGGYDINALLFGGDVDFMAGLTSIIAEVNAEHKPTAQIFTQSLDRSGSCFLMNRRHAVPFLWETFKLEGRGALVLSSRKADEDPSGGARLNDAMIEQITINPQTTYCLYKADDLPLMGSACRQVMGHDYHMFPPDAAPAAITAYIGRFLALRNDPAPEGVYQVRFYPQILTQADQQFEWVAWSGLIYETEEMLLFSERHRTDIVARLDASQPPVFIDGM